MARKRLIGRKRAPRYRESQIAFMQSLTATHRARARRRDRKAFDEYHADLYQRLFPNA